MLWWRDDEGRATLGSGLAEGKPTVIVPGVGSFALERDRVVARCDAGREEILTDAHRRFAGPLFMQWTGAEALHAGAVLGERGVVGLCGASGAGKSTLVANLARIGALAWADDVLVWSPGSPPHARPLPFRLRPRPGPGQPIACEDATREPNHERSIAAIVQLEPAAPVDTPVLEPLTQAEAFDALTASALCLTLESRPRTRAMVDHYFDLATQVPFLRLSFRRDGDDLPAVLALLSPLLCS